MFLESLHIKLWFYILLLLFSSSVTADTGIKTVNDLRELKRQAENRNLPVLLLFTTEDCSYCEAIRKNYLLPMMQSGEYSSKIIFRQLYIEEFSYLRNHKGELIGGDQIALKYDIEVTPTIIFINADWEELADRIEGITNEYYFNKLLTSYIAQAQKIYSRKFTAEKFTKNINYEVHTI